MKHADAVRSALNASAPLIQIRRAFFMVKGKKIVCLCMAFALAAGSACGCTHKENDDGKQGANAHVR